MKKVPSRSRVEDGEEGIDEVREKIMLDLKTAADKMKDAILREEVSDDDGEDDEVEEKAKRKEKEKDKEKKKEREESPAAAEEVRPWNLRTRRSACKAPIGGAGNNHQNADYGNNYNKGLKIEERRLNCSPMRTEVMKSPRMRERGGLTEKGRVKFSIPLTKMEIEDDYMELVGHRPPRRPKKRPRIVQKLLDPLFPGLWLTEVTVDTYRVEIAENGKKW
ncbi:DEAD-box ATP-dependent RNA helicase 42 [Carica papaya]|uniref:DEAD-box ATP-dependent RNA helicase 42 n=1 Tax=Carica papaya TaxID=3649 RepID=UPI000B8D19D8|nr:DEAD-box ATP-dependent RNA helicase 42 [Carica papaya]